MTEKVYHLFADRKGEVTIRLFRQLDTAKQAAEQIWRSWEWWHGDHAPLEWRDEEGGSEPVNDAYVASDEATIGIEPMEIE